MRKLTKIIVNVLRSPTGPPDYWKSSCTNTKVPWDFCHVLTNMVDGG